jgi:hypothetical protein
LTPSGPSKGRAAGISRPRRTNFPNLSSDRETIDSRSELLDGADDDKAGDDSRGGKESFVADQCQSIAEQLGTPLQAHPSIVCSAFQQDKAPFSIARARTKPARLFEKVALAVFGSPRPELSAPKLMPRFPKLETGAGPVSDSL